MDLTESVPMPTAAGGPEQFAPPFPDQLDELDIGEGVLLDLTLKTASLEPDFTTASVAERLRLGMVITDLLLDKLYRDKFIEKKGAIGLHNYRYGVLERGWQRVGQLMSLCSYVGPAPVSLERYTELIVAQVRSRPAVTVARMEETLRGLVLPEAMKRRLALVASSGRSLFLSGPPGNGKTAMARALVNAIAEPVWIPYAIEVDGQIIRIFDQHDHHPVATGDLDYDRRWVCIRPPLVTVGGELTIQSLDLMATDTARYYEAPFQLKANGGVLVVDDLGRQRVSARELLNRWIVPLEYRVDYLTLSTGKKIRVPFEQIVIFATNLTSTDLVDEAFMRRMGYRLYVQPPSFDTYRQIFREFAASCNLSYEESLLDRLEQRYRSENRTPKCCEPRDLLLRVIDLCKLDGQQPVLTDARLAEAWDSYFGGAQCRQAG